MRRTQLVVCRTQSGWLVQHGRLPVELQGKHDEHLVEDERMDQMLCGEDSSFLARAIDNVRAVIYRR